MEKSGKINGAVVSRRKKGDRISLWTSTRKEKTNLEIWCVQFSAVMSIVIILSLSYDSTHLIKCVITAYGTQREDMESFVKQLAEGKKGLSLVFMHHSDALRSGHSFHNDAHITLIDHLDVRILESCCLVIIATSCMFFVQVVMQNLVKILPK